MVKLICKSRWVVSLDLQSQVVSVVVIAAGPHGEGQALGVVLADGQLAGHAHHLAHLALTHEALLRRVEAHHALAADCVAVSVYYICQKIIK